MIDETQVVNRLLAGDFSAADKIVNKYEKVVYQYCLHFLGSGKEAEEASAHVFVRLFSQLGPDATETSLRQWIMRIATGVCMDWQKRYRPNKRREREQLGLDMQIHYALQRLVRQQRAIILLRDMAEMSEKEIASILDIKESAVTLRLTRARNNLCDFLIQNGADLGVKGAAIERKSKDSQHYHELCSRYVDENVTEEEKAELLNHIQTCENCAAYLQALTKVGRELSHMGSGSMPESLKETILDAVRLKAEQASYGYKKRKYIPMFALAGMALVFVVLICSGVLGGMFANSSDAYADSLLAGSASTGKGTVLDFDAIHIPDSVTSGSYSFAIAAMGEMAMPELSTEAELIAMDDDTGAAYYTIDSDVGSAEHLCQNLESFGYTTCSIDSSQIVISGSAPAGLIVVLGEWKG